MLQVQVVGKNLRSQNVVSLDLSSVDGSELPNFAPGAHIDLHLQNGLVRQYSLFHSPSQRDLYRVAVQLSEESRGGSAWIHRNLQVGDIISISEPRNIFELEQGAGQHILFAGGIGITPLLSMAESLNETNQAFTLHYSAKSTSTAAFTDLICQSNWQNQVQFYFSDQGRRVNADEIFEDLEPTAHIYVCGPERYIEYIYETARNAGWPDSQVHRELFQVSTQADSNNTSFEIHLSKSGITLDIPEDSSVLEELTKAGIDIPYSCEQGVCGTCTTRVLNGTPEHRDHYLTDEEKAENNMFLPCCSRAKTPSLTIEL